MEAEQKGSPSPGALGPAQFQDQALDLYSEAH